MSSKLAKRGPTRERLQWECKVSPVQSNKLLRWYFNGARQLLLQGDSYYKDGELMTAYVYMKRFLILAVEEIPEHQSFGQKNYAADRNWLRKERDRVFPVLVKVSAQLDERDAAAARTTAPPPRPAGDTSKDASKPAEWWDDLPEAPTGDPTASTSSAPKPPLARAPSEGSVAPLPPRRPSSVVPSAPSADLDYDLGGVSIGGYGGGGAGVGGGAVGGGGLAVQDAFRRLSLDQNTPLTGHYPSVGVPEYQKERPSMRPGSSVFGVDRRVVLPARLVEEFDRIAKPNTERPPDGIETCGILAGKLSHNVLEMTTLIIPKQEGTSDSCGTTDETGLFNYMLANKLITLGWIHTHPKQSCFMSSVDLHTHCGYQLMLPEAVAVVYAPSDNKKRLGVFRLTQPDGMKLIQECKLKGFHVHPDHITIYEEADLIWSQTRMDVVDMR